MVVVLFNCIHDLWCSMIRTVISRNISNASCFPSLPQQSTNKSKRTPDYYLRHCRTQCWQWLPSYIRDLRGSRSRHLRLFLVHPSLWKCLAFRPADGRWPGVWWGVLVCEERGQRKRQRHGGGTAGERTGRIRQDPRSLQLWRHPQWSTRPIIFLWLEGSLILSLFK